MAYWLLKTEPSEYCYADLERAGRDRWDGVRNPGALKNLRRCRPGDQAFIYHTGNERSIVGIAEVVTEAYPDPDAEAETFVVVDVRPIRRLPRPVRLKEIKANPSFRDWELVRQPRLSVLPVTADQWQRVLEMSQSSAEESQ